MLRTAIAATVRKCTFLRAARQCCNTGSYAEVPKGREFVAVAVIDAQAPPEIAIEDSV